MALSCQSTAPPGYDSDESGKGGLFWRKQIAGAPHLPASFMRSPREPLDAFCHRKKCRFEKEIFGRFTDAGLGSGQRSSPHPRPAEHSPASFLSAPAPASFARPPGQARPGLRGSWWGLARYALFERGNSRIRFPVAAKIALQTAGANGGTPGSPTPAGGASLSTM